MTSVFDDPDKIKKKDDTDLQKQIQYFADEFRALRKQKGLSQYRVSQLSGVSQKMISELESGGNFKIDTYIRMLRGIGQEPRIRIVNRRVPRRKLTDKERVFGIQSK